MDTMATMVVSPLAKACSTPAKVKSSAVMESSIKAV